MQAIRTTKALSEAGVAHFKRTGLQFPLPVLSAREAADYRRQLEAFEQSVCKGALPNKYRYKLHLILPFLDNLVRHPKILDAVEDIIGPDILVWNSTFFIKEAKDPSYVGWHQDMVYWGLTPPESVTAWVAFTDSNIENGAMRVIPGTFEPLAHIDTFAKNNMLSRGQEISVAIDQSEAVDVVLRAGEASLHDARLAHGSEPNQSSDRRMGFAIRYVPTLVEQIANPKVATRSQPDVAVLVRGVDTYNHFVHAPRPRFDMDPACVAIHDRST